MYGWEIVKVEIMGEKIKEQTFGKQSRENDIKETNLWGKFGEWSSRERKYGNTILGRNWREIRHREMGQLNEGEYSWERNVWEDKN